MSANPPSAFARAKTFSEEVVYGCVIDFEIDYEPMEALAWVLDHGQVPQARCYSLLIPQDGDLKLYRRNRHDFPTAAQILAGPFLA